MKRWTATILAAIYFGAVVITATATALADDGPHRRVIGTGQIRFDGAGPERWAQRYRRERRAADRLRSVLAARLDRIVGMVAAFYCVHSFEGSWTANTGNGYFGGLQFGAREWLTWRPAGAPSRADLASPAQQITAGIAYHAVAGFAPWPNTARRCGLIR